MKKLLIISALLISYAANAQSTNWYEIATPTDKQLNTINFASDLVGYIGGNDSTLLKTTDGGKTWNQVNFTGVDFWPAAEHIVNLKFVNDWVGYMTVGPYGGTYKTIDGGTSWTPLTFAGNMCFNQGMYFWDENNGVVGGSGCFQGEHIEQYSSGTFTPSTVNTPSWTAEDVVLDIDFYDANFGLAASESRFLRTTDGGATWDTIPSGFGNPLTSVEIVNDTLAFAGYIDSVGGFGVLYTHDSGLTWAQDVNSATFYYPDYMDVGETNYGQVFSVGGFAFGTFNQGGIIFEYTTSQFWYYYEVEQTLRSVDSYADSTVFAVGDSGYVVTNMDTLLLSLDNEIEEPINVQIFPNPAKEQINVLIDQGQNQVELIRILDLSGREVMNIIPTQSVLDIKGLIPGMYLLEATVEGRKVVHKFMKE